MKTVAYLALIAGLWAFAAWMLMLVVGIIHHQWIPQLPPIGYTLAALITTLLGLRAFAAGLVNAITSHWAKDKSVDLEAADLHARMAARAHYRRAM